MDSENAATSAAGPPANRPERDTTSDGVEPEEWVELELELDRVGRAMFGSIDDPSSLGDPTRGRKSESMRRRGPCAGEMPHCLAGAKKLGSAG